MQGLCSFTYDIQQVMMNFQDGGRPQVTMARAEQKPVQKSRLAVVTEATASRRWIFYEGANRTLFAFKYPEMKGRPERSHPCARQTADRRQRKPWFRNTSTRRHHWLRP